MGDIGHQFGFKKEVTWGTAVTVDRFLEFTSESLSGPTFTPPQPASSAGRRFGGAGRRIARQTAQGSVTFEVATKGYRAVLRTALRATASVNTVGTVWTHTFTPGTIFDKSMTIQKGVDIVGTTAQAFTYPGAKVRRRRVQHRPGRPPDDDRRLRRQTRARHYGPCLGLLHHPGPVHLLGGGHQKGHGQRRLGAFRSFI